MASGPVRPQNRTVRLIAVFLLFLALAPATLSQPVVARPPNAIAFWNPSRGLATMGRCDPGLRCPGGAILLTDDGGRSFRLSLRTARPARQLQTVGARGAIAWLDNGAAFRTEDGGRSWHRDRSPLASRPDASLATWKDALAVEGGSETKLRVLVHRL